MEMRTWRALLRREILSARPIRTADSAAQAHTCAGPPASSPVAAAAAVSANAAIRSVKSGCGAAGHGRHDGEQRPHRGDPEEREPEQRVAVDQAMAGEEQRTAE